MRKVVRHELVSVLIPANSTLSRFNIPDLPNLRNVHLLGLQVYTVDQIAKDIVSQNTLLPHTAVLHNSFITLVNYGGKEFLKQAPSILFSTSSANLNTSTNWFETNPIGFVGQKANYPKSFIEFTTPPSAGTDKVFVFSVFYSLPIEQEKMESGFSFNNKG
jgi:hypothetical protein